MYVCSCFGITEQQVREHAEAGACTPRQIASASKAGTDCGSCVRRIQGMLGRGACPTRQLPGKGAPALVAEAGLVAGTGGAMGALDSTDAAAGTRGAVAEAA